MSADGDPDKARRFRDAALPHLDDVYTLARYLMRNQADADDAVQECYLRAFRHFDGFRGQAIKPWLMAILRNVCQAEFARRGISRRRPTAPGRSWKRRKRRCGRSRSTAEAVMLRQQDEETIRRLVAALAGAVPGGDRAARHQ